MSHLFSPISFRDVTLPNRIGVSPMCEYSSEDGFANDWHLVHLGSRAVGGAGLVFTEASAVLPEGRITPNDLGIWKDEHIAMLARIVEFLHGQGARAASNWRTQDARRAWRGRGRASGCCRRDEGGWTEVVAPSAIAFDDHYAKPQELDAAGIARVTEAFGRRRGGRSRRGSTWWRYMRRMGICCMSFCRRCRTGGRMGTGGASRTGSGCWWRRWMRCGRRGRKGCRSLCGFPRRTGPKAAGTRSSRWSWRGC